MDILKTQYILSQHFDTVTLSNTFLKRGCSYERVPVFIIDSDSYGYLLYPSLNLKNSLDIIIFHEGNSSKQVLSLARGTFSHQGMCLGPILDKVTILKECFYVNPE